MHGCKSRSCGRSDVLIRQYSFINPARLSILVHQSCSFVNPAGYHGTINASSFLLIRSCSFVPARSYLLIRSCWFVNSAGDRGTINTSSFLLIRSCSFVPSHSFLLVGSCSLVPVCAFLLGRSCPFILARLSILLATVVQSQTGHHSLDALQAYEQDMDAQSHHISRI